MGQSQGGIDADTEEKEDQQEEFEKALEAAVEKILFNSVEPVMARSMAQIQPVFSNDGHDLYSAFISYYIPQNGERQTGNRFYFDTNINLRNGGFRDFLHLSYLTNR